LGQFRLSFRKCWFKFRRLAGRCLESGSACEAAVRKIAHVQFRLSPAPPRHPTLAKSLP
jgi:hypothetical protein